MEIAILIIISLIFLETSFLLCKNLAEKLTARPRRRIFVDTSVLMDGRILEIAKTGFISDDLVIPRSVIRELQLLADGRVSEKRARARFGLDVVSDLERVVQVNTEILPDALDRTPVDERLIQLAQEHRGAILTNDYNLNKVATAEGIAVLNINDLALVLRTEYLPGDRFRLKITAKGSNPKQGVGHLADGTMVVVDNASGQIGKELEVEFVRFLQTSAGRMLFAKIVKKSAEGRKKRSQTTQASGANTGEEAKDRKKHS